MLDWLVEQHGIAPHIPVFDMPKRPDGTFSRDDIDSDCRGSSGRRHAEHATNSTSQPLPRTSASWLNWSRCRTRRSVGWLMRENGIKAVRTRKYKATTDSDHAFAVAPNLLDRDFPADAPNQKWAGDISYIWTRDGWPYLAVILDLYSRRVIGWAVSDRLKRDLAIRVLNMAAALRRPPPGCIHHTDRGSQYCSHDYQNLLCKHGFLVSMSGRGNCYDNAIVETFFKTLTSRP